jgi:hypothetical protein
MALPPELRSLLLPIHKNLDCGKCSCGAFVDVSNAWIPRIMVGARKGIRETRLIVVGKNPGHPVPEEALLYRQAISAARSPQEKAELLFDAMVRWGEKCHLDSIPGRQGIYHRRLMKFLRDVLDAKDNGEVLDRVYFTEVTRSGLIWTLIAAGLPAILVGVTSNSTFQQVPLIIFGSASMGLGVFYSIFIRTRNRLTEEIYRIKSSLEEMSVGKFSQMRGLIGELFTEFQAVKNNEAIPHNTRKQFDPRKLETCLNHVKYGDTEKAFKVLTELSMIIYKADLGPSNDNLKRKMKEIVDQLHAMSRASVVEIGIKAK